MSKQVRLFITETKEVLGTFDSIKEADEFFDQWYNDYPWEIQGNNGEITKFVAPPSCTFQRIDKQKSSRYILWERMYLAMINPSFTYEQILSFWRRWRKVTGYHVYGLLPDK